MSLTESDYWPNELISSTSGQSLELFTGLPYVIKKGCNGQFIIEVILLPTLHTNQYFIKVKGRSSWLRRYHWFAGRQVTYIEKYDIVPRHVNDSVINRLVNSSTSVTRGVNNLYYWTFDKESSNLWSITSSLYTDKIEASCGSLTGVCSEIKYVNGGYVASFYK